MALVKYQNWAVDEAGNIVASSAYEVRDTAGVLVSIYSDAGGTAASNPGTATAGGLIEFYAEKGVYDITAGGGPSATTQRAVIGGPDVAYFASRAEAVAAVAAGSAEIEGKSLIFDGLTWYKAVTGSTDIGDMHGWNVLNLNINSATSPTTPWGISDWFGGSFVTHSKVEADDSSTYAGPRSALAVSRTVSGSGTSGIEYADTAAHFMVAKDDHTSTTAGEVDGIRVNAFGAMVSDVGGILLGAYKPIGDGTVSEGAVTTSEMSCRRFGTDITDLVHWHQSIIGFSPNPAGQWAARDTIGFYSEVHEGDALAHFLGINSGDSGTTGATSYLLAGYRERDPDTNYFNVDSLGNIESTSNDAGAGSGPKVTLRRDSASPAVNDVNGDVQFYGRNAAAEWVRYSRIYSVINDATDGAERGSVDILTTKGGSETREVRVSDGVSVGSSALPQGAGTINTANGVYVGANVVVDSTRGVVFRSYSLAELSSASNAVNTANKVAGKTVRDSTNNRLVMAGGSAATDPWYLVTGTLAFTPS